MSKSLPPIRKTLPGTDPIQSLREQWLRALNHRNEELRLAEQRIAALEQELAELRRQCAKAPTEDLSLYA